MADHLKSHPCEESFLKIFLFIAEKHFEVSVGSARARRFGPILSLKRRARDPFHGDSN